MVKCQLCSSVQLLSNLEALGIFLLFELHFSEHAFYTLTREIVVNMISLKSVKTVSLESSTPEMFVCSLFKTVLTNLQFILFKSNSGFFGIMFIYTYYFDLI